MSYEPLEKTEKIREVHTTTSQFRVGIAGITDLYRIETANKIYIRVYRDRILEREIHNFVEIIY